MSFGVAKPTGALSKLTLRSTAPAAGHAHHATHVSTEAIALAAVGAAIVLACLAWGAARLFTFEPRWTLSFRHAFAEARFRVSATWAELSDWARLGR
jgi:hypothetical protein